MGVPMNLEVYKLGQLQTTKTILIEGKRNGMCLDDLLATLDSFIDASTGESPQTPRNPVRKKSCLQCEQNMVVAGDAISEVWVCKKCRYSEYIGDKNG